MQAIDTPELQRLQYSYGSWQVDDDEPRIPGEPDPMASAQARRAWRTPTPRLKTIF